MTTITQSLTTPVAAPDPATQTPSAFSTTAAAFVLWQRTFALELQTWTTQANTVANEVSAFASQVAINASASASNAAIAATSAGATLWVSGTTYAIGDRRYSPANGLTYRRLTAGAGTTDPSADTTNWTPIGLNAPAQLVTTSAVTAISGQCLALSNSTAQGSATNLLLYSDDISNAAWVKGNVTVNSNASMGPNGEITADKVVEAATTAAHIFYQLSTTPANVERTLSFYAKAAGRTTFTAEMDRDGGGIDMVTATFNLSNGTVSTGNTYGTASGVAPSIVYVGNGWYFCTLSGTCSTSAGTSVRTLVYINNATSYTGDGVSGIAFAGMQLEAGSSASSRIPTTSATATRSAGVVAPQRIVLPASPGANAWVKPVVANGVATNVIDPNGQQFKGANGTVSGPIELDNIGFNGALQFIDGYWRFV